MFRPLLKNIKTSTIIYKYTRKKSRYDIPLILQAYNLDPYKNLHRARTLDK